MKQLINLILFLLPLVGFSQVDTSYLNGDITSSDTCKIIGDTVFYNYGLPNQLYYVRVQKKPDTTVLGNYKIVGDKVYTKVLPEPKLYRLPEVHQKTWNKGDTLWSSAGYKFTIPRSVTFDTLPTSLQISSQDLRYYGGSTWYNNTSTEIKKGTVELPVQVMDSGMKVEVVETRDTVYHCPYDHITYFVYNGKTIVKDDFTSYTQQKVITTRRYKLYIINEYGQKEYLSMELSKTK